MRIRYYHDAGCEDMERDIETVASEHLAGERGFLPYPSAENNSRAIGRLLDALLSTGVITSTIVRNVLALDDPTEPDPTVVMKLHGVQIVGFDDDHSHYHADSRDLEGKTIQRFNCDADNVWRLEFTDGTAVAIEADLGLSSCPIMLLCDFCATNDGDEK